LLFLRPILRKEPRIEPTDITVEILKGIREEIRGTNTELRGLKDQIGDLKAAQEQTNAELRSVKAELGVHSRAIVRVVDEIHGLNDRFDTFLHGAHHWKAPRKLRV
jgi:uncharacterized coiled-coil DUF342 family protein